MKKYLKSSLARYLILGLLALAIGVNVFILNASHLTGNAVPMPFGVGASVVLSGSMEPTLSVGDLIVIREREHYENGDVIVYQTGHMPVVHRIVDISDETVITCGDANNVNDTPFSVAMIKGEVVSVIPRLGYAVWMLKSPVAVVVMLVAAVMLIEISFRIGKTEKEEEKEKIKQEIRELMKELEEK